MIVTQASVRAGKYMAIKKQGDFDIRDSNALPGVKNHDSAIVLICKHHS